MDSILEHNQTLQKNGLFSAADLEENRSGRYSPAQLEREKTARDSIGVYAEKFNNKKPAIRLIFGVGFIVFCAALYFVGVFDILQNILGRFFLPALLVALILAALMILVIIPNQYQFSVDAAKALSAPLAESPLGAIQTIEARANVYKSQGGINRRGQQSPKISHILQMDDIEFRLSESFWKMIQPKRMYRVFAVKNEGWWQLLSMETLE